MRKLAYLITILFLVLLLPFTGWAEPPTGPLSTRNNTSLYPLFFAMTMEEAKTLDQGALEIGLRNDFLKNSYSGMRSAWAVDIKGDLLRTDLNLGYGLTDRLEVGMELPRLSYDGGFSVIHQGEQ